MGNYDVIIIGAGPSGIFCAYELIHKKPELKVLLDRGASMPEAKDKGVCRMSAMQYHNGICRGRCIFGRQIISLAGCGRYAAGDSGL